MIICDLCGKPVIGLDSKLMISKESGEHHHMGCSLDLHSYLMLCEPNTPEMKEYETLSRRVKELGLIVGQQRTELHKKRRAEFIAMRRMGDNYMVR